MNIDPIYPQLDSFLQKFVSHISVIKATHPINLLAEKRKFFESNFTYNPQFRYRPLKANFDEYRQKILRLLPQIPDTEIGHLYAARLKECLHILDLINHIGLNSNKFTPTSLSLYGQPLPKTIEQAQNILKSVISISQQNSSSKNEFLNAQQIADLFKEKINQYNLPSQVIIKPHTKYAPNQIRIGKFSGNIKISDDCKRHRDNISSTIAHEIEGHALRLFNGKQQQYGIFVTGTANHIKDEEGLSTLIGASTNDVQYLRRQALLTLSIHYSLQSNFTNTYQKLKKYIKGRNTCFNMTVRSKRGIADTSQVGAFTKDMYLEWMYTVQDKIKNDPDLLNYAWNGKASLEELKKFTQVQPNSPLKQKLMP